MSKSNSDAVSLDSLDKKLRRSSKMLDECATAIKALELNPEENIRRIGEALVNIFEIQNQIYELRPDLTPDHLKESWGKPEAGEE